ncbi:hypothetical protein VUR80DRAFT_10079 [Thermomyces stellatus]
MGRAPRAPAERGTGAQVRCVSSRALRQRSPGAATDGALPPMTSSRRRFSSNLDPAHPEILLPRSSPSFSLSPALKYNTLPSGRTVPTRTRPLFPPTLPSCSLLHHSPRCMPARWNKLRSAGRVAISPFPSPHLRCNLPLHSHTRFLSRQNKRETLNRRH